LPRIRAHPIGYPITPPVETIEVKDAAITDVKVASGISEAKMSWDTAAGHIHDGVSARRTWDQSLNTTDNVTFAQVTIGDIIFKTGWRLTEHPIYGVVLISPSGHKFRLRLDEI